MKVKPRIIMETKFLIYVDILGFEKLGKTIAKKSRMQVSRVREDFIHIVDEKIEEAKKRNEIIGKSYYQGDSWILVAKSLDDVLKFVYRIINNATPYLDYDKVPLEIAVGIGSFSNEAKLDGSSIISQNSTIRFLKTPIAVSYTH